jgi:hypothetical protein
VIHVFSLHLAMFEAFFLLVTELRQRKGADVSKDCAKQMFMQAFKLLVVREHTLLWSCIVCLLPIKLSNFMCCCLLNFVQKILSAFGGAVLVTSLGRTLICSSLNSG